ncbi:MAG: helix-turn-helix domain-containing protein [Firmicutes bacterium]|nr:helix-turn-helix domain-containing protein [Bacillota bacterium]
MNKNEWEQIAENLKNELKQSEKTQEEIANLIGIDRTNISFYLNGQTLPSLVTLKKLCFVLNCTYEDILGKPEL